MINLTEYRLGNHLYYRGQLYTITWATEFSEEVCDILKVDRRTFMDLFRKWAIQPSDHFYYILETPEGLKSVVVESELKANYICFA
jgi:hypothetical protein